MPIAILMSKTGGIPAILSNADPNDLVTALNNLADTPQLKSPAEARIWLREQPLPSGWYATEAEASAAIDQLKRLPKYSGEPVKDARYALGEAIQGRHYSRTEFANLLGYAGTGRNNGDLIGKIERGDRDMGPDKSAQLAALLAEHGLSEILEPKEVATTQ